MDLAGQIVLATRGSKGIEELLLRLGSRRRKHCHCSKEKVKLIRLPESKSL